MTLTIAMTLATECFIIDCKRGNDHCSTALTTKNSAITAVETTLHVPRCTYVQVHEHSSTSTAAEVNTSITYHLPPLASVTKHRLHALRCTGSRMSSGGQDKISLNELKDLFQLRIGTRETCKNRHIYPEFYDKIPWDEAESYPSAYQDKLREFAKGIAQKEKRRRKEQEGNYLPKLPKTLDSNCDPSASDITVEGDQNHCSRADMAGSVRLQQPVY
ncbi:hypothetical protein QR685DRAFT_609118 [Neurospora intermedia]|uniref:Uncharacterized protein n=1 Tax=Neurospora intermedia TaxID=5142 RepID=A0ABR3D2U3_NEUIN